MTWANSVSLNCRHSGGNQFEEKGLELQWHNRKCREPYVVNTREYVASARATCCMLRTPVSALQVHEARVCYQHYSECDTYGHERLHMKLPSGADGQLPLMGSHHRFGTSAEHFHLYNCYETMFGYMEGWCLNLTSYKIHNITLTFSTTTI